MNRADRAALVGDLRRPGAPCVSTESNYPACNAKEIAAHFPVPSADVADRLLDLLIPCDASQTATGEVA